MSAHAATQPALFPLLPSPHWLARRERAEQARMRRIMDDAERDRVLHALRREGWKIEPPEERT